MGVNTSIAFLGLDPFHAWPAMAERLPRDYRALAEEHRQIQTQYGNAKITNADELLRFVFAYAGSNLPLRQVVAEMEAAGAPRLSAMRLHMKLRQAVPYLHALLQRMVPQRLSLCPDEWRGLEAVHVSSAPVVGPAATQAPERVHAAVVLYDARVDAVAMSDPSETDSVRQVFWAPRQVACGGADAVTPASMARAQVQGAQMLVDVGEPGECPLPFSDALGGRVDLPAFVAGLRRAAPGTVLQRSARVVVDGAKRVEGRLLAFARQGGERAVYFTTIAETTLDADDVGELGERCARTASACGGWRRAGARLSNQRDDTTTAWVYARALLGLLEQRVNEAAA